MSRSSLPLSQPQREQHRNLFAISAVIVAIETDQVALFELAREQDVSAALNWFWHNFFPRALEPLPCHHAMLDREEAQQEGVDNERFCQRRRRSGIDCLGDQRNIADESDRVQKCDQEGEVTN